MLANGENRLGGITFWVGVQATNTVEGRQIVRAVVNPTANTRVLWNAATETVSVQRYNTSGPLGAPMQDLAGTHEPQRRPTRSGRRRAPPRSSSRPRRSARSAPSTSPPSGAARLDTAPAPMDTVISGEPAPGVPDVDPLTTARAYGNLYVRLRLGTEPHVAGLRHRRDHRARLEHRLLGQGQPAGGRRRRPRPLHRACRRPRRAFAAVTPLATRKPFSCIDGLGRYVGREINAYDITFNAADPGTYTAGEAYTLADVDVDITLPAVMLKGLYGNLLNYESLPAGGIIDQPLNIWIAVDGRQHRRGRAGARDRGPLERPLHRSRRRRRQRRRALRGRRAQLRAAGVDLDADGRRADLSFTVAEPGLIPELTLIGRGHSGAAGAVFPMWPYGSFFVRAETGRYGASIDCLEGVIDFDDITIAFSNLGRRSPTLRIPTPVAAGSPPATTTVAAGSAGRYAIEHEAAAPFAVVPAAAVTPAPPRPDAATPIADPGPDPDAPTPDAEGRAELDQARGQEPQGQRQRRL